MPIVNKRYRYDGVDLETVREELGPSFTIVQGDSRITFNAEWDDAEFTELAVDSSLAEYGLYPDVDPPETMMGLKSPDGSIWRLAIDDLGILSPVKVP